MDAMTTPSVPDMILAVALRDGISVDEVMTLLLRWVHPFVWRYEEAARLAHQGGPAWQVWRAHHHELLQLGYSWPLLRV